ncbi:hypothetical protein [Bacillus phage BC-T25]|nr:hypothetical protein [Bacillus phage BC-T25]
MTEAQKDDFLEVVEAYRGHRKGTSSFLAFLEAADVYSKQYDENFFEVTSRAQVLGLDGITLEYIKLYVGLPNSDRLDGSNYEEEENE